MAACAPDDPDFFPSREGFSRSGSATELSCKHEVLFSAFHCEHVGDHLPGYGKRRPILVPSLSLPLINQSQFVAVSRSQFRGLHKRLLNVLVPLFGDGHSNELVRGASLRAAEPAIADGLLDRLEAGDIADLKSPGECSDWPDPGNRPQPLQPLGQQRVSFQRTDQGIACAEADDPDEEPYFWPADGDRSELQQTAAAQAGLLHGADVGQRRGEREYPTVVEAEPRDGRSIAAAGLCRLDLFSMRKQVIVDPPGEDRRFHGDHVGLRKCLDPAVQLAARRSDLAFLMDLTGRVLHAIADRLLLYIQSDVIHIVSEEPPR
jgi:hypothetical protein